MKLKEGVKLGKLQPQMALAAYVVNEVYKSYGKSCTITSANDSKHMKGSLHYEGTALDFRTRDFVGNKKKLREDIAEALGKEFDVVLEKDHLHVEWQERT